MSKMKEQIRATFLENVVTTRELSSQVDNIYLAAREIIKTYRNGKKVLVFGNGGSAADAQHIAGELVGRFNMERKALSCLALTTDTSILTAWSNDYDFSTVFQRQVQAHAEKGDLLWGISTSGNSENVVKGFKEGIEIGTYNLAMTGQNPGAVGDVSDLVISVPSVSTPRIQECHVLSYHIICDLVEKGLFGGEK